MRSQSPQEMLAIAIPIGMAVLAFVIIMGSFYLTTVSVAQSFIPYKIASMVAHSLTGSTACLLLDSKIPRKGLLDQNKIDSFVSLYSESLPRCVNMPCWAFRATIKDIDTGNEYLFGYESDNADFWGSGDVVTNKLPIVIDVNGVRHFGKLTIEVEPLEQETCNSQIQTILEATT